ncbi:hypothetical protein [Lignipirellula cremea]|uniref:DUF4062 domain-containing protein n=1 Tax=Lignipirellula cremea TaxID=2528010 RepID=A0A518DQJ2_9BACT|nr:hypothetical protein [Lignipirellula cremea]QDU94106.1 hypothetical protein Pla8534_18920 [Lignipirellula cremea]
MLSDQLNKLKVQLLDVTEYPWSNIESWIAKAAPIIKQGWAKHSEEFEKARKKPRQYIVLPGQNPDPIDAKNREAALAAKQRLIAFVEGLLLVTATVGTDVNTHNSSLAGKSMYRRIGVMIGSPGDANEERQAITDAILRWNAAHSGDKQIMLEPVKWETHATPGLRGRPQGMINEELIPKSDCLIAVFRTRAGSPTGKEISGTFEEIREFMRGGKYVAIYFYEGQASVGGIDPDQLKAVQEFKKEIQQHGLTDGYKTVDELSANLAHHLTAIVRSVSTGSPTTIDSSPAESSANPLPLETPVPQTTPESPKSDESALVVTDSGSWALLDAQFYETETVRQTGDGDWVVEIQANTAEEDAHLAGLQPHQYGRSRPIPFAHRNDGFLVTVKSVESVSQGGQQVWTITLTSEDIEYGGSIMDFSWQTEGRTYKPEDFARLRAGRILLNDPPPIEDDGPVSHDQMHDVMLESHIRGTSNPVSVEHCIIQVIYSSVGGDPEKFLRLARLASIYFLKAGGAVERILELALGPIEDGSVHVRFRGQRRKVASNVEPAVIEIEGDCPLQ